jgi:hypothetical protein
MNRELLDEVPSEIRQRVAAAPSPVQFPGLHKFQDPPVALVALVPEGETFYFLARSDEKGSINRVIDLSYEFAPALQRALSGIVLPPVSFDGHGVPTVQAMIVQNIDGAVEVLYSRGGPGYNLVQRRRAEHFTPQQSQEIQPLQPLGR